MSSLLRLFVLKADNDRELLRKDLPGKQAVFLLYHFQRAN
jgi:hypothetical protein